MKPPTTHLADPRRHDARGHPLSLCSLSCGPFVALGAASCRTCLRAAGVITVPQPPVPRPTPLLVAPGRADPRDRPPPYHRKPRPPQPVPLGERFHRVRPVAPLPPPSPPVAVAKRAHGPRPVWPGKPVAAVKRPEPAPLACTEGGTAHRYRIRMDEAGERGVCRLCGAVKRFAPRLYAELGV